MKRRLGKLAAVVALAATLVACGGTGANSGTDSAPAEESPASEQASTDVGADAYYQATNEDGFVNTLIGERIAGGTVTNEEEAKECLTGAMARLGGDETIELVVDSGLQNTDGTSVYTFTQQAGGVLIQGATVKLVVDEDGSPIGIVSSILPGVDAVPIAEWAIDAAGAEKVVAAQLETTGSTATIVEGATEKVIVADPAQNGASVCAWVVYTFQADAEYEDGIYTAHYVSAQGDYLYAMPVSGLSDPDAESGQSAKNWFDFDALDPGEESVAIQHVDGTTEEVSVPVLRDAQAGTTYLADVDAADHPAVVQFLSLHLEPPSYSFLQFDRLRERPDSASFYVASGINLISDERGVLGVGGMM